MYSIFNRIKTMNKIKYYLSLAKVKVMSLVLLSGISTFFLGIESFSKIGDLFLITLGLFLVGSASNALNQIFECNVDAKMERTKYKRPLVSKDLSIKEAYIFVIFCIVLGLSIFFFLYNKLAFFISLFTFIFYAFFYTLFLKPTTPYNIVIGGISGSTAPLIVWACLKGQIFDPEPWIIFFLIFFGLLLTFGHYPYIFRRITKK